MKKITHCFLLFLLLLPIVANSNPNNLGKMAFQQGQFELAIQHWEEALAQFDGNKQHTQYIDTAVQLAMAYQNLGFSPKAEQILLSAKDRAERIGDQVRRANILSHLGDVYISLGEWQKASESLYQAERIAHYIQSPLLLANILNKQGNLWMIRGDLATAFQPKQDRYQQCLPQKNDAEEKTKLTDKAQECELENQDSMLTNEEFASYDLTCSKREKVQKCLINKKNREKFPHCIELISINRQIQFTEPALQCLAISHGIEKYQHSLANPIHDKTLIAKTRLNLAQAQVKLYHARAQLKSDEEEKSSLAPLYKSGEFSPLPKGGRVGC